MDIIGKTTFVRMSPRKIRLVAEVIKDLPPLVALERLKFIKKRATLPLINVLRQAIGNAKNNFNLNIENLVIKEIQILEGPRLKRIDKSHGARFDRGIKQKRMSHIRLVLGERTIKKEEKETVKEDQPVKIKKPKSRRDRQKTVS